MANMDLDTLYAVDEAKNAGGVWFDYGDAGFLCRHFDRTRVSVQKIATDMAKPYRKLIDAKMLSAEKDREIAVRAFVRASVMDWRNVRIKGEDLGKYDEERMVQLCLAMPNFYVDLVLDCSEISRFRATEETAKN